MEPINAIRDLACLEFHDAVLEHFALCVRTSSCAVRLLIFDSPESTQRVAVTVSHEGVSSCVATFDLRSLVDNAGSGNVQNCRVDVDCNITRLYLLDGLLEIAADSLTLIRHEESECKTETS